MKISKILVIFILGVSAACQTPEYGQVAKPASLTVFVATSLTEAFTAVGAAFMKNNPGVVIVYNFAGSQQLVQQLAQGAPADVFASANWDQMAAAVKAGRVEAGNPKTFTSNLLAVIYPRGNPGGLMHLSDLGKAGNKIILAAQEVPVGGYSIQFLEKASRMDEYGGDFKENVLSNVVSYEENVRAVYSKVALGEADAGIVYATDIPKDNPEGIGWIEIPAELNIEAKYPIAAIKDSSDLKLAEAFIAFVLSPEGQEILASYGFSPVH